MTASPYCEKSSAKKVLNMGAVPTTMAMPTTAPAMIPADALAC